MKSGYKPNDQNKETVYHELERFQVIFHVYKMKKMILIRKRRKS